MGSVLTAEKAHWKCETIWLSHKSLGLFITSVFVVARIQSGTLALVFRILRLHVESIWYHIEDWYLYTRDWDFTRCWCCISYLLWMLAQDLEAQVVSPVLGLNLAFDTWRQLHTWEGVDQNMLHRQTWKRWSTMPDETYSHWVLEPPTIFSQWVWMGIHTRSYLHQLSQLNEGQHFSILFLKFCAFCSCSFVVLAFEAWWFFLRGHQLTWINSRVQQEVNF